MTADLQRLPRQLPGVEVRGDGPEACLVASSTGVELLVNPTARAIWEQCDGITTVDELVSAICQLFDVSRTTAAADVRQVIEELEQAGLVS